MNQNLECVVSVARLIFLHSLLFQGISEISLMARVHTLYSLRLIYASTTQHSHSPLWVSMLIILSSLALALIPLGSAEISVISQVLYFLLPTMLLSLPKSISMIHKNSWLTDKETTTL